MEIRPPFRPSQGFTLLEMMITVAAVGILLAIGVPSFRYMSNTNRVAAEANNLLGDLQFARSEAIKEGQSVSICVSSDVNTVTGGTKPSCITGTPTSWATGWIVFTDANNSGTVDSSDIILRTSNKLASSDSLTPSLGVQSFLRFNREGFAANLTATQYFTLKAPTTGNDWTRCLKVTRVGTVSVIKYDGSTCT